MEFWNLNIYNHTIVKSKAENVTVRVNVKLSAIEAKIRKYRPQELHL